MLNQKLLYFILFFIIKLYSQNTFDAFMSQLQFYIKDFTNYNIKWKIINNLFNKNFVKNNNINVIPNKIHQIWLGSSLPQKYKKLQKSWIKFNPEWEYKLWKDIDATAILKDEPELKKIYDSINNFGAKSDILRYLILYKFGGVYADTDFECLKPFDDLTKYEFFAGLGHSKDPVILCGLIGSVPNHPILKTCIEKLKLQCNENIDKDFTQILIKTSVFLFTGCFFDSYTQKTIIFPTTFFYPLPDDQRNQTDISKFLKNESYAIHYWHLSWMK